MMGALYRDTTLYARVTLLVGSGDLASKYVAALPGTAALHDGMDGVVRLATIHNDRAAFGLGLGGYTWQINLAVTLVVILLILPVCRALARLDPTAPYALGLITGGALGNFVSLALPPAGVLDFIAVEYVPGRELVMNVADLATYAGLLFVPRLVRAVLDAMRRAARPPIASGGPGLPAA